MSPSDSTINCTQDAKGLDSLCARLSSGDGESVWKEIESTAQTLANGLRVRDSPDDNHTVLGKTSLPQTLTSLFNGTLGGSVVPLDSRTGAMSEILRVAANLCMDHDDNRGYLLEVGLPQAIVHLLEGYAERIRSESIGTPLSLSIPHLKVVRNAIGVLLNSSVGYAPVRTRLTSLEAVATILKLSVAIYPPRSWMSAKHPKDASDAIIESWTLRSSLSNWSWRAISELKEDSSHVFDHAIIPLLIPSLLAFTPPYPKLDSTSPFAKHSPLRTSLLQADFDSLEESCMFLESLALDVEDFRLSLARGLHFPAEHDDVPCLSHMLSFVERGDFPPLWYEDDFPDVKGHEKAFNICKGAMIKAIVEVSGEEKNEEVLWDEEDPKKPGGIFVCKMVEWIRDYIAGAESRTVETPGRDDMVICATLSLGNLARRENHSTILLSPPHSIAPFLSSSHLLEPTSDIRMKHGVVSLLKHLAQSSSQAPDNIAALTNADVVKRLSGSGIWEESADPMREVVQVGAIGVVKHLCNTIDNTIALVLYSPSGAEPGLKQILRLGLSSDSIRVKSEGTRVLVNVIKCLWSGFSPSSPMKAPSTSSFSFDNIQEKQRLRVEAMRAVSELSCVQALARLVTRSGKYPILVNEGTVALSLLSTQKENVPIVTNAIRAPVPFEVAAPPLSAIADTSQISSPTSPVSPSSRAPSCALDMFINVLQKIKSQITGAPVTTTVLAADFPLEVGANVCALLAQTGKWGGPEDSAYIKETAKPILEDLLKFTPGQGKEGMVSSAAKRALDAWVA